MAAGTEKGEGPIKGIGSHAWSVLGYDSQAKTVTLRNPWGYLDQKKLDLEKYPSIRDLGNGEFTMSLEDFHKSYKYISVQDN